MTFGQKAFDWQTFGQQNSNFLKIGSLTFGQKAFDWQTFGQQTFQLKSFLKSVL
jgi:hypothetical protein